MPTPARIPKHTEQLDSAAWADRCRYWLDIPLTPKRKGLPRRREHLPLVLSGHGMSLRVQHGALVVRGGFTHYPQRQEEWRFFPGDPKIPSRIVLVDGSGSISFDVLDWLSAQRVPLIRINWRGEVLSVLSGTGYVADSRKVSQQLEWMRYPSDIEFSKSLIDKKIVNSIQTLKVSLPPKSEIDLAVGQLLRARDKLLTKTHKSVNAIRGIEGEAAIAYFNAWRGMPIEWRGTGKRPIPNTWRNFGVRSSYARKRVENRNASHPVNAMLNYAYAILQGQIQIQAVSAGYDPRIGLLHAPAPDRPAFVLDLMEPLRPMIDRQILDLVQTHRFHASDFTLRPDGVCRLNPELARSVVRNLISTTEQMTAGYLFGSRRLGVWLK